MFEPYVAAYLRTKWATVDSISTIVPGNLHYGRKVGDGSPYAKFTVTIQRIQHISDGVRHAHYAIALEVFSQNTTEANLQAISKALDYQNTSTSSLLAALLADVRGAISSGAGTPGGSLLYCWRSAPASSDTLMTEDERLSGRDVHVTKWACKLGVQWP